MPIYEYYSPDTNKIYQFFARSKAQAESIPACPDNPAFRMVRVPSTFAIGGVTRKSKKDEAKPAEGGEQPGAPGLPPGGPGGPGEPGAGDGEPLDPAKEARLEAAMGELERDFEGLDENDPRQMGRAMRRMSELTGEPLDGEMEEVVRKLEEGVDPDKLEDQMGDAFGDEDGPGGGGRGSPSRDPGLYDY